MSPHGGVQSYVEAHSHREKNILKYNLNIIFQNSDEYLIETFMWNLFTHGNVNVVQSCNTGREQRVCGVQMIIIC